MASQARGNAREILYAASPAVFHGVKSAVSGPQKLFRGIAIFRKAGHARADGKLGSLGLRGEALANARNDARGNVLAGFGKHERKFVAAIAGGCVDGPRMTAKNFPDTH